MTLLQLYLATVAFNLLFTAWIAADNGDLKREPLITGLAITALSLTGPVVPLMMILGILSGIVCRR